jgi:uncharacterized protein YcbX
MKKTTDVTSMQIPSVLISEAESKTQPLEPEELHSKNIDELVRYIEGGKKKTPKSSRKTPVTSVSPSVDDYPELDKEVDEFRQRLDIPVSPERFRANVSVEFLEKLKTKVKTFQIVN